jgi:hypothetical protein
VFSNACGEAILKGLEHPSTKVTLTFKQPLTSHSDLERVQDTVKPTHIVYARAMVEQWAKDSNSVSLDPFRLPPCFRKMLPAKDLLSVSGDSAIHSSSLYCSVALAINISNIASAQTGNGSTSIPRVLSSLVPITQIQQIVAMTKDLNHQCNDKELKISVSSALQELATMLPCTIYVHGDVKSISEDIASLSETQPLVFEPKRPQSELGTKSNSTCFMLESDTSLNLAFSACTGSFWTLVPNSLVEQYNKAYETNSILKEKVDEHHSKRKRGAFVRSSRQSTTCQSGNVHARCNHDQYHGLCSLLHKVVFEQNHSGIGLLPAFTERGILRMLTNQIDQPQILSASVLVMQIDALSSEAFQDLPELDRAFGMVLGQHFFDPASTDYFLCVSAALMSHWYPQPEDRASFHLDCIKICSEVAMLLSNMGSPSSQLAPKAMPTAIAAAAVLSIAMPVEQALDCWKLFNRCMVAIQSMSKGVESAGVALISLLAFVRHPHEALTSSFDNVNQVLHFFFDTLQSDDQGVQLLKTLYLSKTGPEEPNMCLEDSETIGEVLVALLLVSENQDLLECLRHIKPGKPSASIVGLVAGALSGFSCLSNMPHVPYIHGHQAAQLKAIVSVLANCSKVCTHKNALLP